MIFDKKWFQRHQKILLFLCNCSLIRFPFRWVLKTDLPWHKDIIELAPNAYKWIEGRYVKVDIRTHDKFAKRLYYALKPLWYMFHAWDWLSSPVPAWNLGFDSYVDYPAAGANTPVDGETQRLVVGAGGAADEPFATIRGGSGTHSNVTAASTSVILQCSSANNPDEFNSLVRGHIMFDLTIIGDGGAITAGTLSLWGIGKTQGLGQPDLYITKSTAAATNALATSDYSAFEDTLFGSIVYGSYNAGGAYNAITLNAAALTYLEGELDTGFIAQLCARTSWDVNNSFGGTWANNSNSSFQYRTADQGGTTNDPKLTLTYLPLLTGTLSVTLDPFTFLADDAFIAWGTVYQKQIEDWVRIRTHTQLENRLTEQMFVDWTNWAVQSLVPKIERNRFYITTSSLGTGTSFSLSSLKMRGIEKVVDATNGLVLPVSPKEFEVDLPSIDTNTAYWVQEGETLRISYGANLTGGVVTLYYWRVPNLIDSRDDTLDIENSYMGYVLEYCVKRVEEWKRAA